MNVLARRLHGTEERSKTVDANTNKSAWDMGQTHNFKVANMIMEWGLKTIATLKIHQITDTSSIAFLHKWPASAAGIIEWCAQGHAIKWWVAGPWSHLSGQQSRRKYQLLRLDPHILHTKYWYDDPYHRLTERRCDPQAPSLNQDTAKVFQS